MADNPHFASVISPEEAEAWVGYVPRLPSFTAGFELESIAIFVRDHKMREVPIGRRAVELHYGGFVVSQSRPGRVEARRLAIDVGYGQLPLVGQVVGHEARTYELGPVPEPDDIDPRSPSVIVWHDDEVFFLVASSELAVETLMEVAVSVYR